MRSNLFLLWLLLTAPLCAVETDLLLRPLTELNAQVPSRLASTAEWDEFEWRRADAISKIASRMVQANYCQTSSPQWVNEVHAYEAEAPLTQFFTAMDTSRLNWAWLDAFVKDSFRKMRATGVPSLKRLLTLSTPKNRPVSIIFWQRAQKAGIHRTTHHVGLNPDLMKPGENLFLMTHELAHRTLSSLELDERSFRKLHSKINTYVAINSRRGIASPPLLPSMAQEYVRLGLELQLLNEWRVWTTAFFIYEKVLQAPRFSPLDPPWGNIRWVDDILAQRNPGEDIRAFTFRYLDARFTDPHDAERPFLDAELKAQREALRQKMARHEVDLRELEQVVSAD